MVWRIVAAAVRLSTGPRESDGLILTMPPPARHHTIINAAARADINFLFGPESQGFITETGEFVNRKVALVYAIEAGQTPGSKYNSDELFSEDLW